MSILNFVFRGRAFSLKDLMQLVASDAEDPHKILEKEFEWRHSRRIEIGKWLLTLTSSIVVAIAVAILSDKFATAAAGYLYISLVIAIVSGVSGIVMLLRAYIIGRAYVRAAALLGDFIKLRPFLKRLRLEGHL
jgi:F0F1-type ATP synthase assembly protein I